MGTVLSSIDFRRATENDFDFLYALHVATMKEYVDKTWGWNDVFQETTFRKRYIPAELQIITCDGKDMGMLSIEEREDDVFLRAIEVHPDYQNKGVATSIIHTIIADGIQKKKPVRLYVLKANPAKRLYDRLGFSIIEETATHYIMLTSISN
jgi:ribosomal protein S18 acetylase RimI-like enzyme